MNATNELSDGTTYNNTTSSVSKHPKGGFLTIKAWPAAYGADVVDTRRIDGKRRSVRGRVAQCGTKGWRVIVFPAGADEGTECGYFKTQTADAAWELGTINH